MLEGLDAIDWGALEDAYGSAEETPRRLRALLADDKAVRDEASYELFGSVWHQGTIYSVSAHVVPFLVELLAAPHVEDKPSILVLLASIAGGRGYYEVHEPILKSIAKRPIDVSARRAAEANAVGAVRRAVSPHLRDLLPHLAHAEPEVRRSVAEALPYYPEHYEASKPALQRARAAESDPEVAEVFDEAMAAMEPASAAGAKNESAGDGPPRTTAEPPTLIAAPPAEKPVSHRRMIVARLFGAFAVFFASLWVLANGFVMLQVITGVYEGPEGMIVAIFFTGPPTFVCGAIAFILVGFRRARLAWIGCLIYALPFVLFMAGFLFELVLSVFK